MGAYRENKMSAEQGGGTVTELAGGKETDFQILH